jgi:hypothetical protein
LALSRELKEHKAPGESAKPYPLCSLWFHPEPILHVAWRVH